MQTQTSAQRLQGSLPPFDRSDGIDSAPPLSAPGRAENQRHARPTFMDLLAIPVGPWSALHASAIELNGYYDPAWAIPVARHARGHGGAQALLAWDQAHKDHLIGLMPVRWSRQALRLPVPMLVAWSGYAPLTVPLLHRDCATRAAGALLDAGRQSGACALFLPNIATDGAAFAAIQSALSERSLSSEVLRHYKRAGLDATQDAGTALRSALGAKKLKELRRQRHRLEDSGALVFGISSTPAEVADALEAFLVLEQKGWKGLRGTALGQDAGEATFIRKASAALAAEGRFQIFSLKRAEALIAAGLVLRDADRAYFFKIASDEDESRNSPGVQLTLEITRHLCADPGVTFVDSSADGDHPMIDHVWRERADIADVFIPLSPRDPLAYAARILVLARYAAVDVVKALQRLKKKYT